MVWNDDILLGTNKIKDSDDKVRQNFASLKRNGLILSPANSDVSGALQPPFCEWITVGPGKVGINEKTLTQSTYAFITWSNLASGQSQTAGTTYYVYACNNSGALAYRLHTDGTLITVDSMDTRKIGYFHNSPPNHPNYGAYNSDGDILMYSIFSDEEDKYVGMVDIGICKADIYTSTLYKDGNYFGEGGFEDYADGAEARSTYNKNPGVYISWYEYKKAFARVGKFMLNPYQWYLAGLGTPDPDTTAPNERLDIDNKSAAFNVDEVITGQITGATATVKVDAANYLEISGRGATQFQENEQILGGVSGSTADVNNAEGAVGLEPVHIWNTGASPNYLNRKPEHSTFSSFIAGNNSIKTGTAPKAVSTRGCYNIIGNILEWTDLLINDGKYNNDVSLPAQNYIDDYDVHKGLPIATAGAGVARWHNDFFWINTSGLQAALRSGVWNSEANAGLFALNLNNGPSASTRYYTGSRGGKL